MPHVVLEELDWFREHLDLLEGRYMYREIAEFCFGESDEDRHTYTEAAEHFNLPTGRTAQVLSLILIRLHRACLQDLGLTEEVYQEQLEKMLEGKEKQVYCYRREEKENDHISDEELAEKLGMTDEEYSQCWINIEGKKGEITANTLREWKRQREKK